MADLGPQVRRALIGSFALYVVLGLPDGVLGVIWPDLRDHFGRGDSGLGLLTLAIAIGYGGASMGAGFVSERHGVERVVPTALAIAAVALFTLTVAPTWWLALVGFAALGVGWGAADTGVNAWMALTQGPRQMGLLHASYGVGAVLGPLLGTVFIAEGGTWRGPYLVCGLITAATAAMLLGATSGFAAAPTTDEVRAASGDGRRGSDRLLGLMVVWFGVYVGIEVAIGSWSFTLLTEGRGESTAFAGLVTAAFWGGLTAGRFLLAWIGHLLTPRRALRASLMLATAAGIVLWVDPFDAGWVALPVFGVALSMMYPIVMGRTAVYLGETRAARAVGYQVAASAVGFTLIPALVGVLADAEGIETAPAVIVATTLIAAALWIAIEREADAGAINPAVS